jgi:putative redox protein
MVEIDIEYTGDLHCKLTHGPSGAQIQTDAPVDNQGKGENFSPTDLVAAAMGSCMLTIMGIVAKRDGLDIRGAMAHASKEMVSGPQRRIGKLPISITLPAALSPKDRQKLEAAALSCPVHRSLHPSVESKIEFLYK